MRAFAALICLALSCLPAFAQETPVPKACRPMGNLLRSIESIITEDKRFEAHVYDGDRAQKIMAVINAEPPETDYKADRIVVLIYVDEQKQAAQSFLIVNDCVTQQAIMPLARWRDIVRKALGDET